MNRGNAGVIGTLVTPSTSVATGVFSLNQLQVAVKNGTWPLFAAADPYFNYVTMLLPGNGTNGAQNNTFLDSSTNNLTITRNGNTTQGTFAPYGNLWSNFFDGGSTNLLSFPSSSTAYNLSGAAWTVQFWVYPLITTFSDGACRVLMAGTNGNNTAWVISIESNYSLTFSIPFGGTTGIGTAAGALARNTWTHVAVVYSGGTARIYFNGVSVAGPTAITLPVSSTVSCKLGYDNVGTVSTRFNGYISNVAINTTTALYTSAFTPPTIPLTAVSGTSLLTCQSNRFIDNSTNALAITVAGNPSVQRFSPFSPTASYAPSVDGGSGYFDGTGDSLVSASSASNILSTNDFTIEFWLYPSNTSVAYRALVSSENYSAVTGGWSLYQNGAALELWVSPNASAVITASAALTAGAWQHIALSRVSGTLRLFVNGTQVGSIGTGAAFTGQQVWIGDNNAPSFDYFVIGYMSDVRIVNGTGLYTTAFTPPTAPLTAITNTSFLANFTNAGIIDNAEMNNLETVGNAQISTAQSKFGGGSMLFDGNGDALFVPPSQNPNFGSGNFTIEFWIYYNSLTGFQTIISNGYTTTVTNGWVVQTGNGDGKINFYRLVAPSNAFLIAADAGPSISTGVWYHIAIVRNGTTTTIYRDGTSVGSATDTTEYTATAANFYVGGGSNTGFNNYYLNGYIDDLRITKGFARYTANFTPPTAPFPTL
jgi:hypothetical protein